MRKTLLTVAGVIAMGMSYGQSKGIINNSESEHVAFKSVNMGDCEWTSGFWADKFKVCEETMVPHMGDILKGDIGHALNNFKIAAGEKEGEHGGEHWHDGDFYKWMEAASYVYAINGDKKITKELDEIIAIIAKAQEEDGYLQTQIQTVDKRKRYENRQFHEMYNSGHLLTSACIHYRVTGQTNFLDIAKKHADYLVKTFSSNPKRLARFGFNQTQIMGLVEMYRTVGNEAYLKLAEQFINNRGKSGNAVTSTVRPKMVGDMVQERTPLRKSHEAVGHAVLALYYYAGAADVYAETGEKALIDALDRLWMNVTDKKMYVTGACGQTHHGMSLKKDAVHEAFIREYMMPNSSAYNETCANICNAMFSYRMLGIHGEAKYADIMELVMYNSALSGISFDGTHYFYANPLRKTHGSMDNEYKSTESANREAYIECFCCPPNLVRTIAKSSGWAYSLTKNGLAVNLYGGNKLATTMLDGTKIALHQETAYPWEGTVSITMDKVKKKAFAVQLRIPAWAEGTVVKVNGETQSETVVPNTYLMLERTWKKGDVITMEMPMDVKLMEGNPRIEEVRNQVAVKRGPVVYCLESPDLPINTSILDVYLPASSELKPQYKADFLGGITTIGADVKIRHDQPKTMYGAVAKPNWETFATQFVPYFAWSNRGTAEMSVWVPIMW